MANSCVSTGNQDNIFVVYGNRGAEVGVCGLMTQLIRRGVLGVNVNRALPCILQFSVAAAQGLRLI